VSLPRILDKNDVAETITLIEVFEVSSRMANVARTANDYKHLASLDKFVAV
jgi:hypothetical protein